MKVKFIVFFRDEVGRNQNKDPESWEWEEDMPALPNVGDELMVNLAGMPDEYECCYTLKVTDRVWYEGDADGEWSFVLYLDVKVDAVLLAALEEGEE